MDFIGSNLTREDMAKMCSTEDLLGQDEMEILVYHHSLNHYSFKSFLRLSRIGIIHNNIGNVKKLPPSVACLFVKYHRRPWRTKGNQLGGTIKKPSETIPGAMTSIDQMVSA